MEVVITYGIEDWKRFQSHLEKKAIKGVKTAWDGFLVNLIIWGAAGAGLVWFVKKYSSNFHWPTAIGVAVVFTVLTILFFRHMNRIKGYFKPSEGGCFLGTHSIGIYEEGIETKGDGYRGFYEWSIISNIERENGVIMLFIDTANALIFPEDRLDDPDGLYEYILECNK